MVTDVFVNSLEFYLHPEIEAFDHKELLVPRLRRLRVLGRDRPLAQHRRSAQHLLLVQPPDRLPGLPLLPALLQALARADGRPADLLPPLRADRRPRSRSRTSSRRRASASASCDRLHLEAAARLLHLHRVRALHRRLPRQPHRQAALAQAHHRRHPPPDGGADADARLPHGTQAGRSAHAARRHGDGTAATATPTATATATDHPAHRRRRLRADLGLRDLRRLHGGVPRLHRARADDHGHAPLPGDGAGRDAGDRAGHPHAARAARPPLARHPAHPHDLDRGDGRGGRRGPDLRRHQEYLYWVGCTGALQERNVKVTKALVRLFIQAGVSFGVLAMEEGCSGDPARRLGNEYLYQIQAAAEHRDVQGEERAEGHRQLPALLQHDQARVPAVRQGTPVEFETIHHTVFLAELVAERQAQAGPGGQALDRARPPPTTTPATSPATTTSSTSRAPSSPPPASTPGRDAPLQARHLLLRRRRLPHVGRGEPRRAHQRRPHRKRPSTPAPTSSPSPAPSACRCSSPASAPSPKPTSAASRSSTSPSSWTCPSPCPAQSAPAKALRHQSPPRPPAKNPRRNRFLRYGGGAVPTTRS